VAAARLTDIGAADAQPAVLLRGDQHRREELAGGRLEGVALGEGAVRFADPGGERVAGLLQLAEVEDARGAGGGHPVRDVDPAEAGGDEPGQLPLEPADLAAQLGARLALPATQPVVLGSPLGDR
jgi:hypothetical protein